MGVNTTTTNQVINVDVVGKMVSAKLQEAIQLSKIMQIDDSLRAEGGLTLKLPKWKYAGPAIVVAEGQEIPVSQLESESSIYTVKKYAKSFDITDEAILASKNSVVDEAIKQIVMSISDAIDKEAVQTALAVTKAKYDTPSSVLTVNDILNSKIGFGERSNEDCYLILNTKTYASLLKDETWKSSLRAIDNILIKGYQGTVAGCHVIISNRVPDKKATLLQKGAIKLLLRKDTLIETQRNPGVSTKIVATKHALPYVYDESKIINIVIKA